jgi:hypothetical protein
MFILGIKNDSNNNKVKNSQSFFSKGFYDKIKDGLLELEWCEAIDCCC